MQHLILIDLRKVVDNFDEICSRVEEGDQIQIHHRGKILQLTAVEKKIASKTETFPKSLPETPK